MGTSQAVPNPPLKVINGKVVDEPGMQAYDKKNVEQILKLVVIFSETRLFEMVLHNFSKCSI